MPIDPEIQRFTRHDNGFELRDALQEMSAGGEYLAPVDLRDPIGLLVVVET